MKRKWTNETVVVVPLPLRHQFHTVEGYRWDRLALAMDMGRNAPDWMPDEELDWVINECWKNRHWSLRESSDE